MFVFYFSPIELIIFKSFLFIGINLKFRLEMDLPALTSYSTLNQTKFLVNNEMLSDIAFLVGIEKTKICGHKLLLSIGIKK